MYMILNQKMYQKVVSKIYQQQKKKKKDDSKVQQKDASKFTDKRMLFKSDAEKKSKNKFGKKESFFNMKTGVDVLMQNLSKHLD